MGEKSDSLTLAGRSTGLARVLRDAGLRRELSHKSTSMSGSVGPRFPRYTRSAAWCTCTSRTNQWVCFESKKTMSDRLHSTAQTPGNQQNSDINPRPHNSSGFTNGISRTIRLGRFITRIVLTPRRNSLQAKTNIQDWLEAAVHWLLDGSFSTEGARELIAD